MTTDGVSRGKSKAIWDPKSHEIWVNLAKEWQIWDALVRRETRLGWNVGRQTIEAANEWWEAKLQVEAAKFRIKGLDHTFYQLKKANMKRSISSKLTKQLDELCEAVKNKDSYIRTNPPGCSVQEVLDKLATHPGCQPMSHLFKLGIRLFTKKANRETFVALSEPECQLERLKDQQDDILNLETILFLC
ncbi:hypothetical protein KPL70_008275 [Citrus sinensis]|nr:hypothetical protein KPL70_008275 [Citrus sinensis]